MFDDVSGAGRVGEIDRINQIANSVERGSLATGKRGFVAQGAPAPTTNVIGVDTVSERDRFRVAVRDRKL